ncbi:MAG: hypothetical protein ACJAYC_001077 [Halieaceae bacterium]|jgi:hypothetical protein
MNRCIKLGLTMVYTSIFLLLASTGALQSYAEVSGPPIEHVQTSK